MSSVSTTEPPIITAPAIAPTVVAAPGAAEAPPAAALLAGRFKGPQELEKGTRELLKSMDIPVPPDGTPLFGPGAMFPDAVAMEGEYRKYLTIQGKLGEAAKAAAPKTPPAAEIKPGEAIAISPAPAAPAAPATPVDDDLSLDDKLAKVGLTKADLYTQWKKPAAEGGGKLTADQYAKAKSLGWTPKVADEMVATQASAHDSDIAVVHRLAADAAGGEQQLAALIGWANKHYAGNTVAANDLTTRLNKKALTATVINELRFAYSVAAGAEGSRTTVNAGAPAAPGTAGAFTAYAEWAPVHEKIKTGTATPAEQERYYKTTNPGKLR